MACLLIFDRTHPYLSRKGFGFIQHATMRPSGDMVPEILGPLISTSAQVRNSLFTQLESLVAQRLLKDAEPLVLWEILGSLCTRSILIVPSRWFEVLSLGHVSAHRCSFPPLAPKLNGWPISRHDSFPPTPVLFKPLPPRPM